MSKCPHCPFTTTDGEQFNAHIKEFHPPVPQCPSCGFALAAAPVTTSLGGGSLDYKTAELDSIEHVLTTFVLAFQDGIGALDGAIREVKAIRDAAISRAEQDEALLRAQFGEPKADDPGGTGPQAA